MNTNEPPPTAAPDHTSMVPCSLTSKMPPKRSVGTVGSPVSGAVPPRRQNARPSGRKSLAKICRRGSVGHCDPRSKTVTRTPASARRRAVTAAPKPDPTTTASECAGAGSIGA
ncbi:MULTISPECIES: hypothetical protein [unclassified Rhodococcus (in: high G+C Gram-positive bacteria)]|uniref:hypothetical protein n=1 Tax=unclassified Rhodococcus (in: high G+C Gram-positive bacteria) TaxID=192944 RepID=UPI0027E1D96C|nr:MULTISPECIES: hypothetical protein [unclassified Rhodococcus (in: high G+C Gram-positive bacteria)]